MGKKSSRGGKGVGASQTAVGGEVPVVGGRDACPCGSGRRYKACHGREAAHPSAQPAATPGARPPFAGLPGPSDINAMRELVPAATAPLKLIGEHADRTVTLTTVLPMAA